MAKTGTQYISTTGKCAVKWASPEVLHPQQRCFSPASDIWAFGVLLWEILIDGEAPFGPKGILEIGKQYLIMMKIISYISFPQAVGILRGDRLSIPKTTLRPLRDLIHACWKDPKKRPSSAQLAAGLSSIQGGSTELPTKASSQKQHQRRRRQRNKKHKHKQQPRSSHSPFLQGG